MSLPNGYRMPNFSSPRNHILGFSEQKLDKHAIDRWEFLT